MNMMNLVVASLQLKSFNGQQRCLTEPITLLILALESKTCTIDQGLAPLHEGKMARVQEGKRRIWASNPFPLLLAKVLQKAGKWLPQNPSLAFISLNACHCSNLNLGNNAPALTIKLAAVTKPVVRLQSSCGLFSSSREQLCDEIKQASEAICKPRPSEAQHNHKYDRSSLRWLQRRTSAWRLPSHCYFR